MSKWRVVYTFSVNGSQGIGACILTQETDWFQFGAGAKYISEHFCQNGNVVIINSTPVSDEQCQELGFFNGVPNAK